MMKLTEDSQNYQYFCVRAWRNLAGDQTSGIQNCDSYYCHVRLSDLDSICQTYQQTEPFLYQYGENIILVYILFFFSENTLSKVKSLMVANI